MRRKGKGPLPVHSELLGVQSKPRENERGIVASCLQWIKGLNQIPVEEFPQITANRFSQHSGS